jgi:hypothetical protein
MKGGVKMKEEKRNIWQKIFKRDKLKKPNMVSAIYLRQNGNAEPMYLSIDEKGMFNVNNKQYHALSDCRFNLINGKDRIPFVMIREEGLIPEPNNEYYAKDIEERCAQHQDLAIKAIRHAEIVRMAGDEKKMNTKLVIGLVILGIVGLALLKNYI